MHRFGWVPSSRSQDTAVLTTSWKVCQLYRLTLTSLGDTVLHSWEVLVKILQSEEAQGIICDIGM